MDNPTTLLVAIMHVTIVATGLINVLIALSDFVGGKRKAAPIHAAWIVVLFLAYMSFFWETTAILEIEGWDFLSFLSFIIGPIMLFFATNLITAPDDSDGNPVLDSHYMEHSARFFLLLLLVQIWTVGMDVVFENVNYVTYVTLLTCLLFLVLMISKSHRVHIGGVVIAGIILLSRLVLQAL